ncbi:MULTISPECIES: sensor histidine kinase [unclassified Paenibacillus]|uniref:sensor histidine kinase n=1 Tax=unclassified Paenibacillus TaxID=185978 RepID=UPI000953F480|nr:MULTISPECIES: sensor histidine kinase [unclassified Paenibacillus]ASS66618.1 HAMP domain-containing protein [Paenibacillus sp. RUD330]SIQ00717.1 Signal transduction histidine kinase [Paenibacillus sp. RU4X]SIQ19888.1 Signal transduction histidine kinase [Paenibacillus sp. RU4T]
MSIRFKLTLTYSAILAVILIVMGGTVYAFQSYKAYSDVKNKLEAQGKDLSNQIQQYSILDPGQLRVKPSSLQQEKSYIQIVDYRAGTYRLSAEMEQYNLLFPFEKDAALVAEKARFAKTNVNGYPFYVYQWPIVDMSSKVVGLLQVGYLINVQDNSLQQLRTILVFTSLIGLVVAFTVGMLMARQSLRPIEIVIQAAEQIEKGSDLSMRIAWSGPNDELGKLTDTLNGMLGRMELAYNELDEAYDAQRRFVSDASHELRTPLTTIRGNIDLLEKIWKPALEDGTNRIPEVSEHEAMRQEMSREAMRDIGDEARRMSRLVNDLLALARADAGFVMEKKPVELTAVVEDVVRRASMLPRTASWKPGDLSSLEGVGVLGNADYLRQLLFIFIENAFKYTPEGSVMLRAVVSGAQAGIIIQDTGLGMEPEQVPHIFERFYRADESRGITSGTGLGLSIAKWIIDEHEGSVEVRTIPGAGTTFTVWLPIAFSVHVE